MGLEGEAAKWSVRFGFPCFPSSNFNPNNGTAPWFQEPGQVGPGPAQRLSQVALALRERGGRQKLLKAPAPLTARSRGVVGTSRRGAGAPKKG